MKRKGFTLVELLVVIAIIAMLLAILMPALSRVRQLAYQMICGTNQSGIGKAILLYSSENEEKYPEFGIPTQHTTWWDFTGDGGALWSERDQEFSGTPSATISASLFLLVKYADVNPSQFICNAHGATKFELSDYEEHDTYTEADNPAEDVIECWDFGPSPPKHNSFAYNYPYCDTHPDGSSPPSVPLLADVNPWMEESSPGSGGSDTTGFDFESPNADTDMAPQFIDYSDASLQSRFNLGNSPTHGLEGQNVLFNDMHVKFMKTPNVGVEQDNIYTIWDTGIAIATRMRQKGKLVTDFLAANDADDLPQDDDDALLVNW